MLTVCVCVEVLLWTYLFKVDVNGLCFNVYMGVGVVLWVWSCSVYDMCVSILLCVKVCMCVYLFVCA